MNALNMIWLLISLTLFLLYSWHWILCRKSHYSRPRRYFAYDFLAMLLWPLSIPFFVVALLFAAI